jgi:hypothetical protein
MERDLPHEERSMSRVETLEHRYANEQLMTGIELGPWLDLLKRNGWDLSPEYAHRIAMISAISLPVSALSRLEDALYARRLEEMDIDPTLWQCLFPGCMIVTKNLGPRLLRDALPDKRSYDNVAQGWYEAAEDEIALAKMTGLSLYAGLGFPDNLPKYEKYVDFQEATTAERTRFRKALELFVKKIMVATGRRVVIKSCGHSARIPMLLESFPDAKFVLIHRDPYETFASMLHFRTRVDWENFLQVPDASYIETRWETTADLGARVFERMIEDRRLIPPENYYEVAYADFSGNELPHLAAIYQKFALRDWDRTERILEPYLDGLRGYQKNRLSLDPKLKEFVYDRWRLVFDAFGYDQEHP